MPIDQNLLQIGLGSYDPNAGYSSPRLLDIQSGGLSSGRGAPVLAADTASATPAPSGAPSQAPAGNPDDYETRFRSALNGLEQEALRQRKAAGNPLNVAGSIVGGILGMPFRLVENVLGGGNNDLSAPFHPKQNAESNYQATLAAIGDKRVQFERDLAALRSSRATELKTALTSQTEQDKEFRKRIGWLALNSTYGSDPAAQSQMFYSAMQSLAKENPGAITRGGYDQMQYSPQLVARLIGDSGDTELNKAYEKVLHPDPVQFGPTGMVGYQDRDGTFRTYYQGQKPKDMQPPLPGFTVVGSLSVPDGSHSSAAPVSQSGDPQQSQPPQMWVSSDGSKSYSLEQLSSVLESFKTQDPQNAESLFTKWTSDLGLRPAGQQ